MAAAMEFARAQTLSLKDQASAIRAYKDIRKYMSFYFLNNFCVVLL